MVSKGCVKKGSKGRKNRLVITGSGLPDIPSAPVFKTKIRPVDYDFEERKRKYRHLIPIYTLEQVQRLALTFHELTLKTLWDCGYKTVVTELNAILTAEQEQALQYCIQTKTNNKPLVSQPEVFKSLAETLKFCQDLNDMGKSEQSLKLRKELAVRMLHQGMAWLARHLLETCLEKADKQSDDSTDRIKAECHCLIAYLFMNACDLDENVIEENLFHLTICRDLSENKSWHLTSGVIKLRLKKPIFVHGFRHDEELLDGSAMSFYHIAALLEHELLLKLVDRLLLPEIIPTYDVFLAAQYIDEALSLAMDVREYEATNTALHLFGNILQGMGCPGDAMDYFDELQLQAELRRDFEAEAMGYHGLGQCFNGKGEPINALEMFAIQREKAELALDLQGEACQEAALTLLSEGQTVESKISSWIGQQKFEDGSRKYNTPTKLLDDSWAWVGISQGQDLWGRYCGLTRRKSVKDIRGIIQFKNCRKNLPKVKRPKYKADFVDRGMDLGESSADREKVNQFIPFMTNEESEQIEKDHRHHRVPEKSTCTAAAKPKSPVVKRKSVVFTYPYDSPEYDVNSSQTDSSQSPSIFDADMPYLSDATWQVEILPVQQDLPIGEEMSRKYKSSAGMSGKSKMMGRAVSMGHALQSARGLSKMALSTASLGHGTRPLPATSSVLPNIIVDLPPEKSDEDIPQGLDIPKGKDVETDMKEELNKLIRAEAAPNKLLTTGDAVKLSTGSGPKKDSRWSIITSTASSDSKKT